MTSVFMRFGTSPTGMSAIGFIVCESITETERAPEFETYMRLLSGVNVIHSGTAPERSAPREWTRGRDAYPINVRSGREYLKTAFATVLLTHSDLPSGATPIPWDGLPIRPSAMPNPLGLSGSLILAASARFAKSTTAKPLKFDSCTKIRLVDPSAFTANVMGRTPWSNLTSHATSLF